MKKLLGILVLGLIYFLTTVGSIAKTPKLKLNKTYEGGITVTHRGQDLSLPAGEKWKVIGYWTGSIKDVLFTGYLLAQLKGNKIDRFMEIAVSDGEGFQSEFNQFYREMVFAKGKKKNGQCVQGTEDLVYKKYIRGNTFNCFRVRSWDVAKGISNPPVLEFPESRVNMKRFVKKNNVSLPNMMLRSEHYYFSRRISSRFSYIHYIINPENYETFKNKKEYIDNWIKLSAKRHKLFEEDVKANKNEKSMLNLSEFIGDGSKPLEFYKNALVQAETTEGKEEELEKKILDQKRKLEQLEKEKKKKEELKKQKEKAKKEKEEKLRKQKEKAEKEKAEKEKSEDVKTPEISVIDQLKELKKMYDEGVLTKEQFENAKNKILEN